MADTSATGMPNSAEGQVAGQPGTPPPASGFFGDVTKQIRQVAVAGAVGLLGTGVYFQLDNYGLHPVSLTAT